MNFYDILSSIFIFAGCVFILAGSIGVVRLTDALARSHALTKSMTLGIILLQMGMGVGLYEEISGLKIILAILFLLLSFFFFFGIFSFISFIITEINPIFCIFSSTFGSLRGHPRWVNQHHWVVQNIMIG